MLIRWSPGAGGVRKALGSRSCQPIPEAGRFPAISCHGAGERLIKGPFRRSWLSIFENGHFWHFQRVTRRETARRVGTNDELAVL